MLVDCLEAHAGKERWRQPRPALAAEDGDIGPIDAQGRRIVGERAMEQHHVADTVDPHH